jgi:hypothetical protein
MLLVQTCARQIIHLTRPLSAAVLKIHNLSQSAIFARLVVTEYLVLNNVGVPGVQHGYVGGFRYGVRRQIWLVGLQPCQVYNCWEASMALGCGILTSLRRPVESLHTRKPS